MSLSVASSGDVIAAPPDSTAAAAAAAAAGPSTDTSSSNGAEAPAGPGAGAAAAFQLAGAGWREKAAQQGAAFLRVLQVRANENM
jgi:hypothetical protein